MWLHFFSLFFSEPATSSPELESPSLGAAGSRLTPLWCLPGWLAAPCTRSSSSSSSALAGKHLPACCSEAFQCTIAGLLSHKQLGSRSPDHGPFGCLGSSIAARSAAPHWRHQQLVWWKFSGSAPAEAAFGSRCSVCVCVRGLFDDVMRDLFTCVSQWPAKNVQSSPRWTKNSGTRHRKTVRTRACSRARTETRTRGHWLIFSRL